MDKFSPGIYLKLFTVIQGGTTSKSVFEVIAIIPTKNRPQLLRRALNSVANQTIKPSKTYIINDCDKEFEERTRNISETFKKKMNLLFIDNKRKKGLSGSVNTALFDIKTTRNKTKVFLAFLDDDDWWENSYLEKCLIQQKKTQVDWIISGIIRYDENYPNGLQLPIPTSICIDDFFGTNPNIQGSNLFILYDKMIEIGGFDENFVSTTDRDVCIRLLDSANTSYSCLNEHLVHHWGFISYKRLSSPGSFSKQTGLFEFYKKYKKRMTSAQKSEFKKRSKDLFNVNIR